MIEPAETRPRLIKALRMLSTKRESDPGPQAREHPPVAMDGRAQRFELPDGLTPEDERAILTALERYFLQESPKPNPWVLQGRIDATGLRRAAGADASREPWAVRAAFARHGVAPLHGRGDVR